MGNIKHTDKRVGLNIERLSAVCREEGSGGVSGPGWGFPRRVRLRLHNRLEAEVEWGGVGPRNEAIARAGGSTDCETQVISQLGARLIAQNEIGNVGGEYQDESTLRVDAGDSGVTSDVLQVGTAGPVARDLEPGIGAKNQVIRLTGAVPVIVMEPIERAKAQNEIVDVKASGEELTASMDHNTANDDKSLPDEKTKPADVRY